MTQNCETRVSIRFEWSARPNETHLTRHEAVLTKLLRHTRCLREHLLLLAREASHLRLHLLLLGEAGGLRLKALEGYARTKKRKDESAMLSCSRQGEASSETHASPWVEASAHRIVSSLEGRGSIPW